MNRIDQVNKWVNVRIEELESKIRSKKDLYYVLKQCCNLIIKNRLKVSIICQMKINVLLDF